MTTTKAKTRTTTAATTRPDLHQPGGRPTEEAAAAFLGDLFTEHGGMVLGLCRLLLRDPVEAEDAAQQAFVSAQRAVLGGVVPRDPPAWLAAIARNECRARLRSRPTQPLPLEMASGLRDPLAAAIDRADFEAVWAAVAALPRRQRRALLLREVGGLTYAELGVALGVPQTAVQSLLFRARQQLRDAVGAVGALWMPVALREPLARLLAGPPATVAKIAAVATGATLGAVSVVELPQQSQRPHVAVSHAKPARTTSAAATPPPIPVVRVEEHLRVEEHPKQRDDRQAGEATSDERRGDESGARQLAQTGDEQDSGGDGEHGSGGGEPGSESGGD